MSVYVAMLESEKKTIPCSSVCCSLGCHMVSFILKLQLPAAVLTLSKVAIKIHTSYFGRCLQMTKPLTSVVKHTIGFSHKRWGWGCLMCVTWGGDLVFFRVSPVLLDLMRKFSTDIEESCPTVRVQRMRKQVGLSTPWGPSLHQPWLLQQTDFISF